jgi:hypothetical protein
VVVVGCTAAIAVIGLSAAVAVRVERRSAQDSTDLAEAQVYARTGVEMAQHLIRNNTSWRTTYPNGTWETDRAIGAGTYTIQGIDSVDGNLSNSNADALTVTGIGRVRDATYKLQVTMNPLGGPLSCLQVASATTLDLVFSSALSTCNQTMTANRNTSASSSTATGSIEVVGTRSGMTYVTIPKTGQPAREMPSASVLDYYVANATAISMSGIGSVSGRKTIERTLISAALNPYGTPNGQGIYVIDCGGVNLRIRDSRIVGTIVILNPGTFTLENSILWEPAVSNYPSLLVNGAAQVNITNTNLSESSGTAVNFNPADTPYSGATDSDTSDAYPSKIVGIIYAAGALSTSNNVTIDGVMLSGATTTISGTFNLTYRGAYASNPPPGFGSYSTAMQVSSGTWKRLVD